MQTSTTSIRRTAASACALALSGIVLLAGCHSGGTSSNPAGSSASPSASTSSSPSTVASTSAAPVASGTTSGQHVSAGQPQASSGCRNLPATTEVKAAVVKAYQQLMPNLHHLTVGHPFYYGECGSTR